MKYLTITLFFVLACITPCYAAAPAAGDIILSQSNGSGPSTIRVIPATAGTLPTGVFQHTGSNTFVSAVVPVTMGGSGQTSLANSVQAYLGAISTTQGTILYNNGSSWVALAPGTSGKYLKTQGTGANPLWDTVTTTTVANDTIWNAVGDLAVGSGSDTATRLAIGTSGQVLKVNSGATGLEWGSAAGTGTVTSVGASGPTGIFTWSSAITSSGTLTATLATQSANTVLAGPTTGSAATPTFRALVASDVPDVSATYQTVDALPLNVKNYGAVGDTKRVTDAVTNGTTTVTSATASFVAGDIGKAVFGIKTSDGSAIVPMGTISSVTNSTTIVVSVAATGSQTGVYLVYGTDDTAAIQAAGTAADAMIPKGKVYVPSGGYMFSDRLFNPAGSTKSYPVVGDGSASTIFYPTPTHALTGTYYFNTLSNVQNTHYSGFTIDGSFISAAAEAVIVGGDGTRMEDVEIHHFRGTSQGMKILGSECTLTNCWVDFISNGNGITVVGSNCALFDSHSGNNGGCAILILNASQCSATGCIFDECGLSSFAVVNSTSVTLNQSLVYGGDGGASCIYVDGTSDVTVTATRATPYNAGYTGNGLEVLSGGVARIASTNLTGRGTGFGMLNNGTVYDGGNNTISTSSGTAMVYGGSANIPVSKLNSGTGATSSTFWRGDGTWAAAGAGTVTSVAQSFTGGLISVGGSPITGSGTLALTVAGTSGGIPYFSSGTTWATSAALAANALVVGGGAGAAPSTVITGTGVVTALGVNTGSAGAFIVNGGALGTPSSGTVTNLTGTASININGTVGATTPTTGAFTTLSTSGAITIPAGTVSATSLNFGTAGTGIFSSSATNSIDFSISGTRRWYIDMNGTLQGSSSSFQTSGNMLCAHYFARGGYYSMGASDDVVWQRIAANHGAFARSTNAQSMSVANTFTNATNYEALTIDWSSNVARIKPTAAGSGTARTIEHYTTSTVFWSSGSGSPESVVTAPIGSLYTRTDGGANTTLYVKESGSGNTGWTAK